MKFVCKIFFILAGLALCSAAPESVNRTANGNKASKGEFPYMVSIQRLGDQQSQPSRGHTCGGALVSQRKVITTALCLHTYNYTNGNLDLANETDFRVFAGSNILSDDSSADFVRPILNITIHPNFTGLPALVNNVAVIIVATEFPREVVTVFALLLPLPNFETANFTLCNVTGWSSVNQSNTNASVELRFATKYVYNQNSCRAIYNTQPGTKNILPSMICAASYDLRSSNFNGDSGNPLVCGRILTGILSASDNCTVSTFPEVYTRISNFSLWIRSVSGAPSLTNPGILALLLFSFIIKLF